MIYPFGPPGNLTAAFSRYVVPAPRDLIPRSLKPPLDDIDLWLLYHYNSGGQWEGIHLCSGRWTRFGTGIPSPDATFACEPFHYREA